MIMDIATILAIVVPSGLAILGGILSAYFKKQGTNADGRINAAIKLVTDTVAAIADKSVTPEELVQVMANLAALVTELQNVGGDKLTPETIRGIAKAKSTIASEVTRIQSLAVKHP